MNRDILNASGCKDMTAYLAIKSVDKESKRFRQVCHTLRHVADKAGFVIEGRLILKDKKTGKIWR